MKKSLIALALMGAFSGAAIAQSNVTLYGILDVNIQRNDPKENSSNCNPPATTANPNPCGTTTGINGGHQSGNRWGVRGSEALGGGLSAIFTLESGFNIDSGTSAQGGRLFGRQAWAGLQSGWGSLFAGRLAALSSGTGSWDMIGFIDPFLTGFGDANLGNTFTPLNAMRIDNGVGYVSPTFSGFKVGGMYSFQTNGTEAAGSGNNTRLIDLAANWTYGPFAIGVTYDIISPPDAGGGGILANASDQKIWVVGGTWDFKLAKLHLGYMDESNKWFNSDFSVNTVDTGADATAWMVGATVPLFGGSFLASYQDRDGDERNIGTAAVPVLREADLKIWAVGYTYPLSRRTNLYGTWSSKDGKKSLNGSATNDRNQLTFGVRHLF